MRWASNCEPESMTGYGPHSSLAKNMYFAGMKFFRLRYVREIMIVFTGVCFLNMGFFLAEVAALELKEECSQLVGNLVNSGFEEERETESSGDSEEKEVDIMNHYSFVHGTVSLFSLPEMKYVSSDPYWDAHCPEKVCPPPEA